MLLNSLKLILQDVLVPSARVAPIYFRLNRHGAHLHFRMFITLLLRTTAVPNARVEPI
jgi:hypothetical protein